MTAFRFAASFLVSVAVLLSSASFAQAGSQAANAMCPKEDNASNPKERYNSSKPSYPAIYTEIKNGQVEYIKNLWRKPCEDNFVKAFCTTANYCDGEQSGSKCYSDGAWKDCHTADVKVTDPGTQPTGTNMPSLEEALGVQQGEQPEVSTQQGQDLNRILFDPNPLSGDSGPLSPSAKNVESQLEEAAHSPGFIDTIKDFFNPEPLSQDPGQFSTDVPLDKPVSLEPGGFEQPSQPDTSSQSSGCSGWFCAIQSGFGGGTPNPENVPTFGKTAPSALADAATAFGAARGYTPDQIDIVTKGLGGVAQQESSFNPNIAERGQYKGLGQLNDAETTIARNNIAAIATNPDVPIEQQFQASQVVQKIDEMRAQGINPNKDPETGAWLLAGRQAQMSDISRNASPMDAAARYASTPAEAAAIMQGAQLAPSMYARGFDPDANLSASQVRAFANNRISLSTSNTVGDAVSALQDSRIYSRNFAQGINVMNGTAVSPTQYASNPWASPTTASYYDTPTQLASLNNYTTPTPLQGTFTDYTFQSTVPSSALAGNYTEVPVRVASLDSGYVPYMGSVAEPIDFGYDASLYQQQANYEAYLAFNGYDAQAYQQQFAYEVAQANDPTTYAAGYDASSVPVASSAGLNFDDLAIVPTPDYAAAIPEVEPAEVDLARSSTPQPVSQDRINDLIAYANQNPADSPGISYDEGEPIESDVLPTVDTKSPEIAAAEEQQRLDRIAQAERDFPAPPKDERPWWQQWLFPRQPSTAADPATNDLTGESVQTGVVERGEDLSPPIGSAIDWAGLQQTAEEYRGIGDALAPLSETEANRISGTVAQNIANEYGLFGNEMVASKDVLESAIQKQLANSSFDAAMAIAQEYPLLGNELAPLREDIANELRAQVIANELGLLGNEAVISADTQAIVEQQMRGINIDPAIEIAKQFPLLGNEWALSSGSVSPSAEVGESVRLDDSRSITVGEDVIRVKPDGSVDVFVRTANGLSGDPIGYTASTAQGKTFAELAHMAREEVNALPKDESRLGDVSPVVAGGGSQSTPPSGSKYEWYDPRGWFSGSNVPGDAPGSMAGLEPQTGTEDSSDVEPVPVTPVERGPDLVPPPTTVTEPPVVNVPPAQSTQPDPSTMVGLEPPAAEQGSQTGAQVADVPLPPIRQDSIGNYITEAAVPEWTDPQALSDREGLDIPRGPVQAWVEPSTPSTNPVVGEGLDPFEGRETTPQVAQTTQTIYEGQAFCSGSGACGDGNRLEGRAVAFANNPNVPEEYRDFSSKEQTFAAPLRMGLEPGKEYQITNTKTGETTTAVYNDRAGSVVLSRATIDAIGGGGSADVRISDIPQTTPVVSETSQTNTQAPVEYDAYTQAMADAITPQFTGGNDTGTLPPTASEPTSAANPATNVLSPEDTVLPTGGSQKTVTEQLGDAWNWTKNTIGSFFSSSAPAEEVSGGNEDVFGPSAAEVQNFDVSSIQPQAIGPENLDGLAKAYVSLDAQAADVLPTDSAENAGENISRGAENTSVAVVPASCLSEACVGGKIGDQRFQEPTEEQRTLSEAIAKDEAQRRELQTQLDGLNKYPQPSTLVSQLNRGLAVLSKNSEPSAADKAVMNQGQNAVRILSQQATLAGDTALASKLQSLTNQFTSVGQQFANATAVVNQKYDGSFMSAYFSSDPALMRAIASRDQAVLSGNAVASSINTSSLSQSITSARNGLTNTIGNLETQIHANTFAYNQAIAAQQYTLIPKIPSTWSGARPPSYAFAR